MADYNINKLIAEVDLLYQSLDKVYNKANEMGGAFTNSVNTGIDAYRKQIKSIIETNSQLTKVEKEYQEVNKKSIQLQKQAAREADKISQSQDKELQTKLKLIEMQKKQVKEYAQLKAEKQRLLELSKKEVLSDQELIEKQRLLIRERQNMVVITRKERQEYIALTKEIQRNEVAIRKNDATLGRFQRNVGNYGSAFKNFLGAAGVATGIYGVISVLRSGVKIIKDFEKANSTLKAVLGATADEMKGLQNQAIDLGKATVYTSTEITFLQTELARLGMTTDQIKASTEGVVNAASAMGIGLSEAANLIGTTLNSFELQASDSARVADIFAEAVNRSALSAEDLAIAMPYVSSSAKQAGYTLEQTTAMLGILTDRGIDASKAGTALRDIFIDLSTKGISFEQAMNMIQNSTNKTKTAFEIFGKVSAGSAVILSETVNQTNLLTEALEKSEGAAKRMAETMLNNLAGDIEQAKGAWESFVLSLNQDSGAVTQTLRGIVMAFTAILNALIEINKYGKIISEQADKGAKTEFERFKEQIKYSSESIKRKRIELYLLKLEGEILEAQKEKEAVGWTFSKKKVEESINRLNQLEREKALLIELGSDMGFMKTQQDLVINNTKTENELNDEGNKILQKKVDLIEEINQKLQDNQQIIGDPAGGGIIAFGAGVNPENKGTNDEMQSQLKALNEYFKFTGEESKEVAQIALDSLGKITDAVMDAVEQQIDYYDTLIDKQQDSIDKTQEQLENELDRINKLKVEGQAYDNERKEALEKQLKNEQKYLANSVESQKQAKERQRRLAIVQASVDIASAILAIWAQTGGNFWVKLAQSLAFGITGAIQLDNIRKAQYAEGTEYLERGQHPKGRDTIPIMADEGERILTAGQNKLIPKGFKNELIPLAVNHFLNQGGIVSDPKALKHLEGIENNTRQNKGYKPDGRLAWEIVGNHKYWY